MKESVLKTDRNIIFKETFGSEDLVRQNGGVPTAVTFSNGVGTFTATAGNGISYPVGTINTLRTAFTARVRCVPSAASATYNGIFCGYKITGDVNSWAIYRNASTGKWEGFVTTSAGSYAVSDNVLTSTYTTGATVEFTLSWNGATLALYKDGVLIESKATTGTITNTIDFFYVGKLKTSLYSYAGTIELAELYNRGLTSNEVKNLYENRQNRELQSSNGSVYKEILRVDARNGVIANKYSGSVASVTDLISGWDFTSGWTAVSATTVTANSFSTNGAAGGVYKGVLTLGKYYRIRIAGSIVGSGTITFANTGSYTVTGTFDATFYATQQVNSNLYLALGANNTATITTFTVQEVIPTVIPTAVSVVRSGNVWAMNFNGTTSAINCGSYDTLLGNKTFIAWVNPRGYGEGNLGRIFSNGGPSVGVDATMQLYLYNSSKSFYFRSAIASYAQSAVAYDFNKWTMVAVTRTSTGITNIFANGALSGTANQTSGTPVAPTTNLIIGNDATSTATYDGQLSNLRIIDGILSTQEIAQIYQSEKTNYGL